ncbi:hypothetical protein [Paraflavitalea sp. CAU 1676]|uniref:hypothetical protein n=1 Tax=Paraflavitalea sp. CAU 1676 TaxID=3032598 RepID=UPI0023DCA2BB|nr:hypothetical protein [Paraflavitalea sp. CAU 1676]MDF2187243.1 hypothetical protein [Paraflavitalea sp. CAU 1676]
MKKKIFFLAAFSALIITGCRKIEMDGEKEVIIVPGGGGGNNGQTITLKGRIDADTILRKNNTYILSDKVYMVGNHTMTIEAGTTIKGAYSGSEVAVLIISRGSKLVANGTVDNPIVFTSNSPNPASGDWGGIILCGKASINTSFAGTGGGVGILEVEGGVNNANGDALAGGGATPNDDDSSGVLKYVRIEYAGYAFQPDKEVNSLTMAAVGRKTVIDHVQVAYAKDDAFEWFGGTVNCKYLIAYKTQDDDFDTDNGFSGSVQFGLIVRDSAIADVSKSEAFESDNNVNGDVINPQTKAVFCNVSAFGPLATLSNVGNSNFLGSAAQIRRNSSISIFNTAIVGWPSGIEISAATGNATDKNITAGTLQLSGIVIAGCRKPVVYVDKSTPTGYSEALLTDWFKEAGRKNQILNTVDEIRYTRPFDYNNPDWVPFGNSTLVLGTQTKPNTYFEDPILTARMPFIEKVDFLGAIAPAGAYANWHKGWTKF